MPAYNEKKIIRKSITLLDETLRKAAEDYEIIVIDDASTDGTTETLKSLSSEIKHLKIITNPLNEQLGGSLKKGFSRASKDLIFYTDADMPVDYSEIYKAVKMLGETDSDLILGFRKNREGESALRTLSSFIYNRLIRSLFRIEIKDINFSFKLVKKDVLDKLNLKSKGLFIDGEMAIKASFLGYRIRQVGVRYFSRKDGPSHLFRPGVILYTLGEIMKYYREIKKLKRDG